MSTSAVSPTAVPVSSSSSPPRASRPAHPRPTTYTGPSSLAAGSPSAASTSSPVGSVPSSGPPIPPPPRTSSQRQVPTVATAGASSAGSRQEAGQGHRRGQSVDGQQERERGDRDRRRTEDGRTRQQASAASGSASRSTAGNNHVPQPVERSASTRKRQEAEASGSRSRGGGAGSGSASVAEASRGSSSRKETRFGDYILGQTLGEGEFGKVKLGWRRDGGAQVAIKLIRRDSVSPHPNRLSKIYREISILRTLSHPNIVRLHEMVETDRHIGIILEYASGGELFDYILTHRYLKDPPACRLFAQLVSGVGYLHKKGIVHRDLKLENLLLDRNRNIIITDFGFANVFDPNDELGELENRLDDPITLKELEKGIPHNPRAEENSLLSILGPGQRRRSDLMATSCGSPCYAAPELVVSDGLYTGRKVDVWSCGVILYAMLAGYLPFDDDPANPEGDNINLLYKYIVSTPLTFPEYVTPHARDLLRRILVPDPRKRADLFEVARHSWLSPFADIVNKVTSATTGIKDVETIAAREPKPEAPHLTRSASVREPASTGHPHTSLLGGHVPRHHAHDQVQHSSPKASSDAKRRTVQVEYVEPKSQTKRGSATDPDMETSERRDEEEEEVSAPPPVPKNKPTRPDNGMARAATTAGITNAPTRAMGNYLEKQKGKEQQDEQPKLQAPAKGKARPISFQYQQPTAASRAASRAHEGAITDGPTSQVPSRRPSKDHSGTSGPNKPDFPSARPATANSLGSNRLPSRGSYSRPLAPSLAANNVEGKIQMPKSGKTYNISNPIPQSDSANVFDRVGSSATRPVTQPDHVKGHKRANTVGGTSGDSGRFLGKIIGSNDRPESSARPVMSGAGDSRQSFDQGRSKGEKYSSGSGKGRRFSLLPTNFSLRSISGGEHKHERRMSRTPSQKYNTQPHIASQPQLSVPHHNDASSALTASDTSLAAHSAPTSAYERGETPEPVPEKRSTLKKHKKFGDAFEGEIGSGGHGSSGPARRVMDFFRRRGVVRSKGAAA